MNLSIGQEKVTTKKEIEELAKEEVEEDPSDKKKKSKKRVFSFNTFNYEFIQNGNEIQYVTIKNKTKNSEKAIEIIPVDKVETLAIVSYNRGYEYYSEKSHTSDLECHYHENYIIYKHRKKYGLVLDNVVIPAKYDSIGKPYLIRGEKPMMLVAKKKRGSYKWGIITSEGNFLLPMEYDEIIVPIEVDVLLNSIPKEGIKIENTNGIYTDGLYHNQKIIVRKKDIYGLYNANGTEALPIEYDFIEADKDLSFYLLQKGKNFGFVIAKRNKIGTWGTRKIASKKINFKYLKVFPLPDFKVIKKGYKYFIRYPDGTQKSVQTKELYKMAEE